VQCSLPSDPLVIVDQRLVANAADPRPDRLERRIERAWYRHHMRRALMILRRDFNASSVELFECTLRGALVEDLARERGASPQSIYKVQQRLRRRLRDLLDWRFEAEGGGRPSGRSAGVASPESGH
jgi:hypothetical protein